MQHRTASISRIKYVSACHHVSFTTNFILQVLNSLSEGSPHENIILLAHAVIGAHGFQITVDFLGRLAVLVSSSFVYRAFISADHL